MEFSEKLQILRKQQGMTQEQLAEKLYVSRTAVSKWESGKGYPNLESLKQISKLFSISIDELLSGDELVLLAEDDKKAVRRQNGLLFHGIMDCLSGLIPVLPLFGRQETDGIRAVTLFQDPDLTFSIWVISLSLIAALFALGLLGCVLSGKEKMQPAGRVRQCSLGVHITAVIFFALSRQPYPVVFLFGLLLLKALWFTKEWKNRA